MYSHILSKLGLAKNESEIYESLLKYGTNGVSQISKDTGIHRRNVYDTLNHLLAKGLVSETIGANENTYSPVTPRKLSEMVKEKETMLAEILPDLERMFIKEESPESVCIYRGVEGWKNYLRDALEVGEDLYTIGAKGAWADERLHVFLADFLKKAKKKGIKFYTMYDGTKDTIPKHVQKTSMGSQKFLPAKYANNSTIEIFGDRVIIFSNIANRKIDNSANLTVIRNRNVADAFRTWFQMIWDLV
jgi:predicted DNA-binding transcriptional regulator